MESKSNGQAFEDVKDQIGPCGIWRGSCVAGNGALQELTRKYEEVLKTYDVEQWGPKDIDFKVFFKGLASLQNMPLCPGCLKGGGRDNCELRTCTADKGLAVKTDDTVREQFIDEETTKLKHKWPSCILFMNGQ